MKLGMQVGLGLGHIVLNATQLPPRGAQPPIFGPCLLWPNGRPFQLLLSTCFKWQLFAILDFQQFEILTAEKVHISGS